MNLQFSMFNRLRNVPQRKLRLSKTLPLKNDQGVCEDISQSGCTYIDVPLETLQIDALPIETIQCQRTPILQRDERV